MARVWGSTDLRTVNRPSSFLKLSSSGSPCITSRVQHITYSVEMPTGCLSTQPMMKGYHGLRTHSSST
ncbi:unnamed protein product [Ixodes hexagonus]